MSVVLRLSFVAFAFAMLCVPCAAQQVAPQPGGPAIKSGPGQSGTRQLRTANKPVVGDQKVDAMIAGMLALANEEEAVIGKFAAERAKHEQVQKFASIMEKDHSKMAKELQKWAPQAMLDRKESGERDAQADRSAEESGSGFNPINVHRQIANRCIASTEKELGSKKGADFDMCYIGGQCVMHQQMIDKATVLREYVSPDLQESIDKGISAAEDHLKQAKKLIDELASAAKSSSR